MIISMEDTARSSYAKRFNLDENHVKLFGSILILALVGGVVTGFFLSAGNKSNPDNNLIAINQIPKTASQDNRTFRDFAEGKITKKADPKAGEDYSEGTHLLMRQNAVPVALTSSVVDLNDYEGKNVKVYGETQKAIKEGWLMDVGKVEEK